MYQSSCDFIRNCSKAKINTTPECIQSWQSTIDACLIKNSAPIREAAIIALKELAEAYYINPERQSQNNEVLQNYINGSREDLWEFVRMGYVSAIGALPKFIIKPRLKEVFTTLMINLLTPADRKQVLSPEEIQTIENSSNELSWSEARRDSVKALSNVFKTIGFNGQDEWFKNEATLDKVFKCLLLALQEYTIDNRGDIGAWVREAAMNALFKLIVACPKNLLKPETVHAIAAGFVQQAVEKIDRTRALAGRLFCKLIYR